jgi:hypothetical protein
VSEVGVPPWSREFQNQPRLRASSLISGIHCDVSRTGYADRTGTLPELPSSFQAGGSLDFMVRYSTSRSTIRLTNPNALTELVSRVEKEYRELLDLRERVKKAEAAAKRLGSRGKLKTCARPVARVVSRKPIKGRPVEFSKRQLYAMLAEAVRNTH